MRLWWAGLLADFVRAERPVRKDAANAGYIVERLGNETLWQGYNAKLAEALAAGLLRAGQVGGNSAGKQVGVALNWDYLNPAVAKWAEQHAGLLVANIGPDVRAQIGALVTDGLQSGKSIYAIRDELAGLKDAGNAIFSAERAARIARTEVIRAHAKGAEIGYKESGVVSGLEWLGGQSGACPACRALNGKVVALGGKFFDDPKFGDGLPPRHPHCRCAIKPKVVGKK